MTVFWLRIIAMVTMTFDHVGYLLFPGEIWLRLVGRIAFPLFAFMTAEGFRHTHDRRKYLIRLLALALVSEVPFDLFSTGQPFSLMGQNVCFTLAAGVACCWLMETPGSDRMFLPSRILIAALLIGCTLLTTDYLCFGVLAVMIMHHFLCNEQAVRGAALACLALTAGYGMIEATCFAALLPIFFYNKNLGPRFKYLFYAYYPVHMLAIWGLGVVIK